MPSHMFAANMCSAVHLAISNAANISPAGDAPTGTDYMLICKEGYTATQTVGTLTCGSNGDWIGTPECEGWC